MLAEYIEKTVELHGNALAIEYRDGQEWLTVWH